MSFHLIFSLEKTSWRMSSEKFTAELKARWPNAEVKPEVDIPGILLNWSIPEHLHINGSFHRNGLTVGLNGPFDSFAVFSCWYRTLVPLEVPLVLIDEGLETMYPLGAETTPEDIISGRIATTRPPGHS